MGRNQSTSRKSFCLTKVNTGDQTKDNRALHTGTVRQPKIESNCMHQHTSAYNPELTCRQDPRVDIKGRILKVIEKLRDGL